MIPDEAVEAAARVMFAQRSGSDSWRDVPEAHHWFRKYARAALEAAAPYLQSAAWERGVEDGYHHRPNPYKEQA